MSYLEHLLKPLSREENSIALSSEQKEMTYLELFSLVEKTSEAFFKKGVKKGDLIALYHLFPFQTLISLLALWNLGASVCPINSRLPKTSLKTTLSVLKPTYLLEGSLFSFCASIKTSLEPSLFLFTSGTTAEPKIAVLSLESLIFSGESVLDLLEFSQKDRWLLSLPLHHVGGIGIFLRTFLAKGTLTTNAKDPLITHLSYVPTHLYRAWPTYSNLKCVLLGGAAPLDLPEKLPLFLTYGLTEMGSMVLTRKNPPKIKDRYFMGFPLPGRELSLQKDGEIKVKGKSLFQGYWKEGKLHLPLDQEGWFSTKDLSLLDPQEGLAILGRKDSMFISGGENIQPEEIELYLQKIPHILQAAVFPKKDLEFGHRPMACLVTDQKKISLQEIQDALSHHLPKYKIPIEIKIYQKFPQKGVKIDRKKLFELSMKK